MALPNRAGDGQEESVEQETTAAVIGIIPYNLKWNRQRRPGAEGRVAFPLTTETPALSDHPEFIRIGKAAALIGVSVQLVNKASLDGRLPYTLFPGSWQKLYDPADCIALRKSMVQLSGIARARAIKAKKAARV